MSNAASSASRFRLLVVATIFWGSACSGIAFDRIQNRWKPEQVIHIESGRLEAGPAQPAWASAEWTLAPVEGAAGYVRIRSGWKSDQYIHIERGPVEAGAIQPGWHSAMWTLQQIPGTSFVRVRNRWKPEVYLHIERGVIEAGPIQDGWHSAMWRLDPGAAVASSTPPPPLPSPAATPRPTPTAAAAGTEACGHDGRPPCTVAPATLVGSKPRHCPTGSRLFPLVDGGSCWQCPAGMQHTVFDVKGPQACESPAGERLAPARYVGKSRGFDCPSGGRHDFINGGTCWECPSGLARTVAFPVNGPKACAGHVSARHAPAQLRGALACPPGSVEDAIDGGTCWRCPPGHERSWSSVKAADACVTGTFAGLGAGACAQGHANIRGTCRRLGHCGGPGNRPCEIGERAPSCNEGLKENFKRNVCEPLRPGETPFLGGLGSLAEYYGDGVRALCKQTIGNMRFDNRTSLGIGANCTKDIFTAAGCEFLATAMGAKTADMVATAADAGPAFEAFRQDVDRAYAAAPCSTFAEKLAPATRHGSATELNCPAGQFRDPDGSCYSCPDGFIRTLNPVQSSGACVDKPAGELARSACSVFQAATQGLGESVACTAEILQSGVFINEPLGFDGAGREYCMATGELVYSVYFLLTGNKAADKKAKQLEGALQRFVAAAKSTAADAQRYGKIAMKTKGVGAAGQEVVQRLDDLQHCRLP